MGFFDVYKTGRYREKRDNRIMPRWSIPPERNSAEWMAAFGNNPRLAVVNKIASDLSYLEGKLYEVDECGEEREIKKQKLLSS